MHIVECHLEFSGFDDRLVKAGTSVYLWNLSQQFRAAGHRVTALTPAHGLLTYLRARHILKRLDWRFEGRIPLRLDPVVWPGYPEELDLPLLAEAHCFEVEGIEVVLLSGGILDAFCDSFYPPASLEGRDLAWLKPLVFQIVAARFLTERIETGAIIHLHEPMYHYILPAALAGTGLTTVSTVQTNMPVNRKVYAPEVRASLRYLNADTSSAAGLADPPLDSPLEQAMRAYLPRTLLYQDYPSREGHDYISMLALIVRSAAAMDFLSEGQLHHALTQAGTPFELLFQKLAVRRELEEHADTLVVGGCAIGEEWMHVERSGERRRRTLGLLGLNPQLPTIYHNSRYSVQHKGQRELFRAIRRLLAEGQQCNVLLHCLAPQPPADPDLEVIARDYPALARVSTGPMSTADIMDWAASSDLSVFPSKFEMDTFLMAMGEAMASGAIPIATAQQGMRHFQHGFDLHDPQSTGLALPRSFRVDDSVLTDAVYTGLRQMLQLLRENPERACSLRKKAMEIATQFGWPAVAQRFLAVFEACLAGRSPSGAIGSDRLACMGTHRAEGTGCSVEISTVHTVNGIAVSCRASDAIMLEIVLPGPCEVIPLQPAGNDIFVGTLPPMAEGELTMLITRRDGTSVWRGFVMEAGSLRMTEPA